MFARIAEWWRRYRQRRMEERALAQKVVEERYRDAFVRPAMAQQEREQAAQREMLELVREQTERMALAFSEQNAALLELVRELAVPKGPAAAEPWKDPVPDAVMGAIRDRAGEDRELYQELYAFALDMLEQRQPEEEIRRRILRGADTTGW